MKQKLAQQMTKMANASDVRGLGDRAGITGAAAMVIEHVMAPHLVDRDLQRLVSGTVA